MVGIVTVVIVGLLGAVAYYISREDYRLTPFILVSTGEESETSYGDGGPEHIMDLDPMYLPENPWPIEYHQRYDSD